jgi:predicted Fe-Mo cluster-binding NifX family protein
MKILITLQNNDIAPRFDMTTEVLIARISKEKISGEPRIILLPGPASDELCSLAIKEEVTLVICGGIEDAHFQYLNWKKIEVIDRIIGPAEEVLALAIAKTLQPGAIIRTRPDRSTTP